MVNGYCTGGGIPLRAMRTFRRRPDLVSYQGKSGQNCRQPSSTMCHEPARVIGFRHDRRHRPGGGQERSDDRDRRPGSMRSPAVLMSAFCRAPMTVIRGNCSRSACSPTIRKMVDDALRQRAGARWLVDGPQTRDDYIDILALLLAGKNHARSTGWRPQALCRARKSSEAVSEASYEGLRQAA